ncbi:MAG: aldose epimerase family protein [Planctomycetaceae bacterium]
MACLLRASVWLFTLTCTLMTTLSAGEIPPPEPFGKTADGTPVEIYTLKNAHGVTARVMNRGATLVSLTAPDRDGTMADVLFGFDDVSGYEGDGNQYFGCTVGRVCNRIAKGQFSLGGKTYTLAINNEPNSLHGGAKRSFDKVVWKAKPLDDQPEGTQAIRFRYTSPDGEEGFPGKLKTRVTFSLNDANELRIEYRAETDQTTPVSLTNHAYFNLGGEGSATVLNHELTLNAEQYTPTDDTLIPTGQIEPVAGTSLDFRTPHVIGERIAALDNTAAIGYDHNFVLSGKSGEVRQVAKLKDPQSGRVLTVETDQPGIQFYSGNFLHGQTGKGGKSYPHRSACCLETQHYPDSVNHANFPSIRLNPNETYRHTCVYKLSVEQ